MIRHARAILDVDAGRLVDEHAQQPASSRHVPVDKLVAQRGKGPLQYLSQFHRRPKIEKAKKNGLSSPFLIFPTEHIVPKKRGRLKGYSMKNRVSTRSVRRRAAAVPAPRVTLFGPNARNPFRLFGTKHRAARGG